MMGPDEVMREELEEALVRMDNVNIGNRRADAE